MGIGNTTAAAALSCLLLDRPGQELAGPGTGINADGVARKAAVIERLRQRVAGRARAPLDLLAEAGGFEIAALAGLTVAAASRRKPVVVDGFITTAAALWACRWMPRVRPFLVFAHRGAEPGHRLLLEALEAEPLLELGLRLGEGSGAALAMNLLASAGRLLTDVATFGEARVQTASVEIGLR
jgi:nicotinate-nucleotide--dimethylbenzimidazole phosphoribosyltransferase